MAEHVDKPERSEQAQGDDDATRALPPQSAAGSAGSGTPNSSSGSTPNGDGAERVRRRRAAAQVDWDKAKEQIVSLLAGVVRWLGVIFAVILVLDIIFVIGEANPDNGIASFMRSWSDALSIGFQDLFTPDDAKLRILVNYGIAAIFWLVVSALVAKIIRRIGDSINA